MDCFDFVLDTVAYIIIVPSLEGFCLNFWLNILLLSLLQLTVFVLCIRGKKFVSHDCENVQTRTSSEMLDIQPVNRHFICQKISDCKMLIEQMKIISICCYLWYVVWIWLCGVTQIIIGIEMNVIFCHFSYGWILR